MSKSEGLYEPAQGRLDRLVVDIWDFIAEVNDGLGWDMDDLIRIMESHGLEAPDDLE